MSSPKSVAPARPINSTSPESMNESAATPHIKKERQYGTNQHVLNTWWVSIGFFLVNVSFNTAQSFATSVDPLLGSISLSLLYFGWIVSLLSVATKITMRGGCKYTMFVCAIIYSGYIFASIEVIDWLYLLSAVILGIAGGPFWVSEGLCVQLSCNAYEIENSLGINSKLGYFNSIFTFGFIMSKFGGALAAGIIFEFEGDNSLLYTLLGVVNVIGAFSFLFIKGNLRKNDIKAINAKSEFLILREKKKAEKGQEGKEKEKEEKLEKVELENEKKVVCKISNESSVVSNDSTRTTINLKEIKQIGKIEDSVDITIDIVDTSVDTNTATATIGNATSDLLLSSLAPKTSNLETKDATSKVDKEESVSNADKPDETTMAGARVDTKYETKVNVNDNKENIVENASKSNTNCKEQCLDKQEVVSSGGESSEATSANGITNGDTSRQEIVSSSLMVQSVSNNTKENTNTTNEEISKENKEYDICVTIERRDSNASIASVISEASVISVQSVTSSSVTSLTCSSSVGSVNTVGSIGNVGNLVNVRIDENREMDSNDWNTLVHKDSINPSSAAMPKREVKCGGLLFVLIKDPSFKYLIGIGLEWGVMTAWIASDFSALIISNTLKFYILAIEGFIGGIMSIVIGHYIDKIGSLFIFIGCNICLLLCFVFLYIWEIDESRIEIWAILAILIGIGDAGYYTAVPQIFPSLIGSRSEVFAIMRSLLAMGMCGTFFYYTYLDYYTRIFINIILCSIGTLCLIVPKNVRNKLITRN